MEEFTVFQMLPTELRLDIWEQALAEETSSKRLVILNNLRAIPLKNLCSPLLSVNMESRACALKLYNTKLDIYQVPSPQPDPFCYDKYINYVPTDHGIMFPYGAADFFARNTEELLNNIEERGTGGSGVLYVSAKADRFVITSRAKLRWTGAVLPIGEDNDELLETFYAEALRKMTGDPRQPWEISWNLITSRIQTPTLQSIESVVLAEDRAHYSDDIMYERAPRKENLTLESYIKEREPYEMSTPRANLLWRTDIFTSLKYWDHLWFDHSARNKNHAVLRKANGQPDIRRWIATKDSVIEDTKAREEMVADYIALDG
ncbi:hypothetical protein GGR57DRAFT_456284 [Xylariaceae sp. FL1272]|nr:hypothetical protein GGR57DRAFT_456284 [Xylariaceae sp. FL1272]